MGKASRKKRDRDKPPLVVLDHIDQLWPYTPEPRRADDPLTVFDFAALGPVCEITNVRINGEPVTEEMILTHQQLRDVSYGRPR